MHRSPAWRCCKKRIQRLYPQLLPNRHRPRPHQSMEIKPLSAPIAPWADIVDEDFEPLEVQTLQPEAAAVEACNSPWNSCPSRLKT
eukprot:symbB.v1.2.025918.t1/scaffold2551.1/size76478/4